MSTPDVALHAGDPSGLFLGSGRPRVDATFERDPFIYGMRQTGALMAKQQIRFDDGAAYERIMGTWSRLAGEIFIDWLAPRSGLRSRVLGSYFSFEGAMKKHAPQLQCRLRLSSVDNADVKVLSQHAVSALG